MILIWIWLAVAIVAAIIEIVGSGLLFGGVAAAALAAAIVYWLSPSIPISLIVFLAASAGYLVLLRPRVLELVSGQRMTHGRSRPGTALIGKRGVVTQLITDEGGQIRIGHGEFWTASHYLGSEDIEPGTKVDILDVEGLTALVVPTETPKVASVSQSSPD